MPSKDLIKEAKEYRKVDDIKIMLDIIEDNKKVLLDRDKEGIEAITEAYKSIVGMASCMERLIEAAEQERQEGWRPISEAPKDASIIMVPYSDLSGVQLIRWGVYDEDDTKEGWFLSDWSDEAVIDNNDVWLPFPALPNPPIEDK